MTNKKKMYAQSRLVTNYIFRRTNLKYFVYDASPNATSGSSQCNIETFVLRLY